MYKKKATVKLSKHFNMIVSIDIDHNNEHIIPFDAGFEIKRKKFKSKC